MKVWVQKEYAFSASHLLPHHAGQCRQLHGHNYRVLVSVERACLAATMNTKRPDSGMLMDFAEMDTIIKPVITLLDHSHLNDTLPIVARSHAITYQANRLLAWEGELDEADDADFAPTAEVLALVIGAWFQGVWLDARRNEIVTAPKVRVTVFETDKCSAGVELD